MFFDEIVLIFLAFIYSQITRTKKESIIIISFHLFI